MYSAASRGYRQAYMGSALWYSFPMSDALSLLFGSSARVKLLRFFLFNPEESFTIEDVARRARLVRRTARTEINILERAGVIKKSTVLMEQEGKKAKVKTALYKMDKDFAFTRQLHKFLTDTAPLNAETILTQVKKIGKVDVVVMAGVFVREPDQRIDMLIAMKNPPLPKVEVAIRAIEAEIGTSVRFMLLETDDLQYRLGMYDKHTRDIFDYPHEILVDRIGLKNELSKPWIM